MTLNRRTFMQGTGALAGVATIARPALAQAKTKIRVGYLHTLAVDGQMWLADHRGAFDKNGLEPEFKLFQTGLELFQAMTGGSLDVLSTGAVISNFPARGQGRCSWLMPSNSQRPSSACAMISRRSRISRANASPQPLAPQRTCSSIWQRKPTIWRLATSS